MKIKALHIAFLGLILSNSVSAQNDFAVEWTAHMEGETVEANPFNGTFNIKNAGDYSVPEGDTIWYGYFVDGEQYDLAFNFELVSGAVLDETFDPGDQIPVINPFSWPALWESGGTVELCAVVYGIGYESFTGELFTGDIDISNNTNCIFAVLPEYTVSLDAENSIENIKFQINQQELAINNQSNLEYTNLDLAFYSLTGERVYAKPINVIKGESTLAIPELPAGVYVLVLKGASFRMSEKIVLQ